MNRKAKKFIMIFLVVAMFMITGCVGGNSNSTENTFASLTDVSEQTPHQISENLTKDGSRLSINADVDIPRIESLYEVTLIPDKESAQQMAKTLITTKYENVTQLSSWKWVAMQTESPDSATLATFGLDNSWIVNYTNVVNDVNYGQYYGEDNYGKNAFLYKYGYITDVMPRQMGLTSDEACDAVRSYLKDYTKFTFLPYRVLAADSSTDSTKPGYYTVWMRAVYDNVPICIKSDGCPIGVTAFVSKAGIVDFQGVFLLKQSAQKDIQKIVTLESVMARLKKNFSQLSKSRQINIDHISLEYVEERNSDGSYTLRPVWAFYGNAAPVTEKGRNNDWVFIYSAEDGTLYDCGDLYSSKGGMQACVENTPANT